MTESTTTTSQFDELPDAPPKRRLKLSWSGKLGLSIVIFWIVIAFIGPFIAPFHEAEFLEEDLFMVPGSDEYPEVEFQGISKITLLGTDYLGRDTLSRIMWGARTTIGISLAATLLAYFVGVTLGIAAAVGGTKLDTALSRFNDAFLSIPHIMLGLIVIAAVGSTIPILIIMSGLIYATSVFRIARSLGQEIFVSDYVEAARVRGEGLWWVITREVLPNVAMPLATDFGLRLVFVILFISSLSFLGLGVQPPMADWGSMVKENLSGLAYGALAPMAPAFAIASLTISINMIVDDISAHSGGKLAKRLI